MTAAVAVPDLIELATKRASEQIQQLAKQYKNYVSRSAAERRKIAQMIEADGKTLDVKQLFELPQAWSSDYWPAVGISHFKADKVRFRVNDTMQARFISGKYNIDFKVLRSRGYSWSGEAPVPLVPKSLVPWNPLTQRNMYVLFDVKEWENKQEAPIDPYLLERKNSRQFNIVAHWDLTDSERELMKLLAK